MVICYWLSGAASGAPVNKDIHRGAAMLVAPELEHDHLLVLPPVFPYGGISEFFGHGWNARMVTDLEQGVESKRRILWIEGQDDIDVAREADVSM